MEVEMIKGIEDWHPPKLETLHFTRMTKHCCLHQIYLHTLQVNFITIYIWSFFSFNCQHIGTQEESQEVFIVLVCGDQPTN